MINKEKFQENFRYYDNEIIVEVMDIFFNEYADTLEVLEQSIGQLDFATINHKAHALKGVVSYMSPELSELCHELEKMGKEKINNGLQQVFRQLKEGTLELVDELKILRQEYAA
jgi:HPt (histidine-containing phosphotransfer) domain-containing protein